MCHCGHSLNFHVLKGQRCRWLGCPCNGFDRKEEVGA